MDDAITSEDTARELKSSGAGCGSPDPIGLIREEHELQLELCCLLETIADNLPRRVSHRLASTAVTILEKSFPAHMQFEDEALFPLLRKRAAAGAAVLSALDCLADEHERDAAALVELTDALREAADKGAARNPEMFGYPLRGFFDGQRRHIAWEDRVIVPAARDLLTPVDLAELQQWVMASDHYALVDVRRMKSGLALCRTCPDGQHAAGHRGSEQ
ncbi:MAG: hemerythrin domain-containing protein [Hyphomicrobiaceae bacterium]